MSDDTNQFVCLPGQPAFEVSNLSSGNTNPAEWFLEWATGGYHSDSGVTVNGYTALTHCPLWQGVNIITGDIGQVPVRLMRNEFDEQRKHVAWKLLRLKPNTLQSPSVWKETMMQWALIWGNGVSWIIRNGTRPAELIPLRPDCLWPELVSFDATPVLLYHYSSPTTGKQYTFFPWQVLHIQGLTGDGIWGYPLHQIAKNCIGHGLALQQHGNMSFANGAMPGGVLEHPGKLGLEARQNLRREWEQIHGGRHNAGRIAVLWEGMKFQQMAMTNIDAQWIDAKKLSIHEAAALLNLPPHKLGAMEDSSVRSNLEEQNADYAQRSLMRWFNRLAEEYRRKLLLETEWMSDEYEFVHDLDQFLRGDIDTTSTVVDRLIKAEVMNRNEGRRWFRLPPYPGGEKFGSPAINPQKDVQGTPNAEKEPESGEESADNGGKPPMPNVRDAVSEALVSSLEHVIERENHALQRAAKGAKNFVEWLDSFYLDNGEPSLLSQSLTSIAGKNVAAATVVGVNVQDLTSKVTVYGMKRRRLLLEACSHVTAGELVGAVDALMVSDPAVVARQFLEDECHVD